MACWGFCSQKGIREEFPEGVLRRGFPVERPCPLRNAPHIGDHDLQARGKTFQTPSPDSIQHRHTHRNLTGKCFGTQRQPENRIRLNRPMNKTEPNRTREPPSVQLRISGRRSGSSPETPWKRSQSKFWNSWLR